MLKKLFLICLMLLASMSTQAQNWEETFSQNINTTVIQTTNDVVSSVWDTNQKNAFGLQSDQEQILAYCLSFEPLQDAIPSDIRNQIETYNVLFEQSSPGISAEFKVEGLPVSIIGEQPVNSSSPYYNFLLLKIDGSKAWVRYIFKYTKDGVEKAIITSIHFTKSNSVWNESNHNIMN